MTKIVQLKRDDRRPLYTVAYRTVRNSRIRFTRLSNGDVCIDTVRLVNRAERLAVHSSMMISDSAVTAFIDFLAKERSAIKEDSK